MSLYGALFSGVSGLAAQSSAMGAISDNITNVNTVGYKGTKVNFQTLVTKQTSGTQYAPGGVQSKVRHGIDVQGLLQSSSSSTDVALSGSGFFVVNQTADPYTDGNSMFAYTRAGSFKVDREGYLQNVSGWYMQGWPLMPTDNTPQAVEVTGSDGRTYMKAYKHPTSGQTQYINDNIINPEHLKAMNLNEMAGTATKTRNIRLGANLPADAEINDEFKTNVLIYDTLGGTHNTQYSWAKTNSNVWDLQSRADSFGVTNTSLTANAADTAADFTIEGALAGGSTTVLTNGGTTGCAFSATAGTITFATAADSASLPVGTVFTISGAEDTANNGTYYVTGSAAGVVTVSNTKYFAERGIPAPEGSAVAVVYDDSDAVYAAQGRLDFTAASTSDITAMNGSQITVTINGVDTVFEFSTDGVITGDVEVDISSASDGSDVATALANAMRNPRNYIAALGGTGALTAGETLPTVKANGSTVEIAQRVNAEAMQIDCSDTNLGTYCLQNQARSLSATGSQLVDTVTGIFDIPAITQTGNGVTFNGDGTPDDFNLSKVAVTWSNGSQNMTQVNADIDERMDLFLGNTDIADGLTQLSGSYQLSYISQDGAQFGNFAGVSIGSDGVVTALFDNGVTRPVFQIPVATFINANGMESLTGNVFISTDYSGEATLREAGEAGAGEVAAGSLESSTVDIGEEFTTMIVTQRAYSAAAKIITSADEMLSELVNIKR
ncbi:flagellar hook-basal body complex protein [Magnetospirillum sp. UT-4]|uniref:flagellar hook-basal body complex protein n=1 Tax=Magnetospirillum sp. UT-4 TaxID=2681467 RepID=UPI001382D61F|nr:flagellar hook-basal body complex protein [Magnetospirillum sp. UT-4]CAA7620062.1 Flagellar hook protein FlgE [Magnetospirillum sp. UT-4]